MINFLQVKNGHPLTASKREFKKSLEMKAVGEAKGDSWTRKKSQSLSSILIYSPRIIHFRGTGTIFYEKLTRSGGL